MIQGIRRALFSNEAGIGSAAIAHSAVKTDEPVTEGFVANLEPFIDTVVVCTMTALVIVVTDSYQVSSANGIFLIILATKLKLQRLKQFPRLFREAVFFHQRQNSNMYRCQCSGQPH